MCARLQRVKSINCMCPHHRHAGGCTRAREAAARASGRHVHAIAAHWDCLCRSLRQQRRVRGLASRAGALCQGAVCPRRAAAARRGGHSHHVEGYQTRINPAPGSRRSACACARAPQRSRGRQRSDLCKTRPHSPTPLQLPVYCTAKHRSALSESVCMQSLARGVGAGVARRARRSSANTCEVLLPRTKLCASRVVPSRSRGAARRVALSPLRPHPCPARGVLCHRLGAGGAHRAARTEPRRTVGAERRLAPRQLAAQPLQRRADKVLEALARHGPPACLSCRRAARLPPTCGAGGTDSSVDI